MPISQPQIPNLTVAPPNVAQSGAQLAQLSDMLASKPLIPLQIQEAQQQLAQQKALAPLQVQQEQIKTRQAQIALESQQNLMNEISSGNLNKFFGKDANSTDGSGIDAAGAYQYLLSKKVSPEFASQFVTPFQTITKNASEIRKYNGEAGEAFLKNYATEHKSAADSLEDITNLPPEQQAAALTAFQADWMQHPPQTFDKIDQGLVAGLQDPGHIPVVLNMLRMHGLAMEHQADLAKAAGEAAGAKQKVEMAATPSQDQLTTATNTLASLTIIPQNLRAGFANEMRGAPDVETLQKVQARADAASESFQRSADAQANARAMKDIGLGQVVAGKLVAEDEKLGTALDQSAGIRQLLDMSKGGNQAATAAALTRFAEHEIVEGGVKRMNQTEYQNLAGSLGSYGRKFTAWADGGFKGEMPPATNAEIGTILDAEDKAAQATHERTVGYINDRYAKPQAAASGKPGPAKSGAGKASGSLPAGATHIVPGSDGKRHYTNAQGTVDLGIAP